MKLGRIDEGTTANVGMFNGGEARNSIPETTKLLAECRSLNHDKAIKLSEEMKEIFTKASNDCGTKIHIDTDLVSKGYKISAESDIVKEFVLSLEKHGVKPEVQVIVAGTDASLFNEHGIPAVVVGIGCRDIHSKGEYAIISEMETITKVLVSLVEGLA